MAKWLAQCLSRRMKVTLAGTILILAVGAAAASAEASGVFPFAKEEEPPYIPPPVYNCGDYSYIINEDETVTISGYNGNEEEIIIPAELDGRAVSGIGTESFSYKKMKSLTIPAGITDIRQRAFEYCRISERLELPEQVTVGKSAFAYASLPSEVRIPEGSHLSQDAFAYNKTLTILIVGSGAVLDDSSFGYSYHLKAVVCEEGSVLGKDAFEYCYGLEQAILRGDVIVHEDAFSYCDNAKILHADREDPSRIPGVLPTKESDSAKGFAGLL